MAMGWGKKTTFIIASQVTICLVVSVESCQLFSVAKGAAIRSCQVIRVCGNTKTPQYWCDRLTCREKRRNLPLSD